MVVRKERNYYKAVRRVVAVVNSGMELKQIFDVIVRNTGRSMDAAASLVFLDSTKKKLIHSSSWGLPQYYLRKGILGDIEPKEGDMNESKTDAGKNCKSVFRKDGHCCQ